MRNLSKLRQSVVVLLSLSLMAAADIRAGQPQARSQAPRTTNAPVSQQTETLDALRERIAAHIAQPRFAAASWGVKIVSLDSRKTLFEHNAQKYFNPASNAKLYTAALALNRLGAGYRIRTSLYSTMRADASGTLKADLIVYGRGDPAMAARLNNGDYLKGLDPLVSQLVNAGVRRIEGDLVGDESYFAGPPFGAGWEWDDLQAYYGAETSALTIDDNSLDLFVKPADRQGIPCRVTTGPPTSFVTIINRTQTAPRGSESRIVMYRPVGENIIYVSGRLAIDNTGYYTAVAVHNPAGLFVNLLKEALAARGIVVNGRARVIDWKFREVTPINFSKMIELGYVESIPLVDIVRETLKPSQNLYAQLLLLQVGANAEANSATGSPEMPERDTRARANPALQPPTFSTTEDSGVALMNEFVTQAGIKSSDVLLEEGSGLSRRDVITPDATAKLLDYASRAPWSEAFRNALPVAGVDGTLQNRMNSTPAAGNVRAKTGSLRYVYTLSGYVTTAAGERLAFSIMLNNYYNAERSAALRDGSASQPRRAITSPRDDLDAIAIMLASFSGKSQ